MQFIIIFGPPASGKMTVGKELAKLTGLKLFHNHMTIELVLPFFEFSHKSFRKLVNNFRKQIFEEVANSELKGLIFTYVWAFDTEEDKDYIYGLNEIFKDAEIYYVELEAELSERLKRNKSESRLIEKPSKRDTVNSEKLLLYHGETHQLNSPPDYFTGKNYLRINNTELSPEETAKLIIEKFKL